jgi:hypothetical protein
MGSKLLSVQDTDVLKNTFRKKSKMSQNTLVPNSTHHKSFSQDTETDSSPLSSIDMSLLEGPESRTLETGIAVEDAKHRKRKPEDGEVGEADMKAKRPRQTPTVAHMIDEIEAYIDDHNAHSAIESTTTRDSTLTPSSPKEYNVFGTTGSITEETTLPTTSPFPTSLASIPPLSLSPQHFLLARIPGSAPLRPHTIAKAASWFAKLLTDGNGTDMVEIHKTLGIRLYQEEDLEEYQRLRSEAAAGTARNEALGLADWLIGEDGDTEDEYKTEDEDDEDDGVNEFGTGRDEKRKRSRELAVVVDRNHCRNANGKEVSKPSHKNTNKPTAPFTADLTTHTTAYLNNTNRTYTLRLKHKGNKTFHGNGLYTADGRPKTEDARRKLEKKDRKGAEDVVRVYE